MQIAALLLSVLIQEDDPVKAFEADFAKKMKAFPAFTCGAMSEAIRFTLDSAVQLENRGLGKDAARVLEAGAEAIGKAILALETRPAELRKAVGCLDKARKRAADLEGHDRKAQALRYGLHRALLVYDLEASGVTQLFNLSTELIGGGAYDEAEDALREVEDRAAALQGARPADAPQAVRMAPILVSRIHLARGQYKEAAAALRRGIDRTPEWAEQEIAIASLHQKNYLAIAKALDEHLAKNADDADAQFLKAHEVFMSAERKKSAPLFEAMLRKDPRDRHAQYFLDRIPDE